MKYFPTAGQMLLCIELVVHRSTVMAPLLHRKYRSTGRLHQALVLSKDLNPNKKKTHLPRFQYFVPLTREKEVKFEVSETIGIPDGQSVSPMYIVGS